MSLTHSIFVPTINFSPHVTKPLIPFLLIKASCDLFGENEFAVRLPSAIVALLTVISFYYLARKLFEERYRWLAVFVFSSTIGFVEFARLAQSEIYQLFGVVTALAFYVNYRDKASFIGYAGFFFGLLFGALSKGLTAPTVLLTTVAIDLYLNKRFYHFNLKLFLTLVLSLLLYFLPYYLTAKALNSPLPFYLWFKENLKQAVDPYDNLRPFYIYFFYYPLWVAPFSLILIFCFATYFPKFKRLASDERWLLLSNLAVFLIFTLAKARRGYYILPILPFAVLLIITFLRNIQSNSWIIISKLLENIYKVLAYLFILLLFISPLFIKLYRYELKLSLLILYLVLLLLSLFTILSFNRKELFIWHTFSLLSLSLLCLFYAGIQPIYSESTEKLTGEFVKGLKESLPYLKERKICYIKDKGDPVANVYFYAKITEKVEPVILTKEDLKACGIVIVRKELLPDERRLLESLGYQIREFIDKKEKSKSYFVAYVQSSDTLNTPSR
jgi:4-amino-4-deoxy-L-arabinose transferase-like glycosyltransferase